MSQSLLAACFCAAWCRTCGDYASVFESQAQQAGVESRWVDIEDHEALLDGIEIENFPTLLVARGDELLFFGPLEPQPQTLRRLLQAARDGELAPAVVPAEVAALPARLRRWTG